ncbi:MAG TPA: hypothetical protein VNI55_03565, partial [Gaiellaceae bacterium]|nr:hypothetical protein [Gaiellaceae bacterium]
MFRRTWPRFVLEACFLFAVAIVAGWLDFSIAAIVAVMLVAYLATAAIEWAVSRSQPAGDVPALAGHPLESELDASSPFGVDPTPVSAALVVPPVDDGGREDPIVAEVSVEPDDVLEV